DAQRVRLPSIDYQPARWPPRLCVSALFKTPRRRAWRISGKENGMKAITILAMLLIAASAAGQGTCPGGVCPAPGTHVPGSGRTGLRVTATPPPNVGRITHRLGQAACHGSGTLVASDG